MMTKQVIVAFDFDETLIKKDSLVDFLAHSFTPITFLFKALIFIPNLFLFKLGRFDNGEAKQRLLTLFLAGLSEKKFRYLCQNYLKRLSSIESNEAIKKLQWHRAQGHQVVIISASPEDWIKPWAKSHDVDEVIATRLEKRKGLLTGKLAGKNCYGPEKVARLVELFPSRQDYELYVYGDGKSDQDLFKFADHVFEKRFA